MKSLKFGYVDIAGPLWRSGSVPGLRQTSAAAGGGNVLVRTQRKGRPRDQYLRKRCLVVNQSVISVVSCKVNVKVV